MSAGTVIVMEKLPAPVAPLESVAVAETVTAPVVVGVPVTAPVDETLKPSPAEPDHVKLPVPPVAVNCPVYGCPTVPAGRLALTVIGAAVTVMLNPSDAEAAGDSLSVAMMTKLKIPGAVAVPLSVLPERLVPVGALPDSENL